MRFLARFLLTLPVLRFLGRKATLRLPPRPRPVRRRLGAETLEDRAAPGATGVIETSAFAAVLGDDPFAATVARPALVGPALWADGLAAGHGAEADPALLVGSRPTAHADDPAVGASQVVLGLPRPDEDDLLQTAGLGGLASHSPPAGAGAGERGEGGGGGNTAAPASAPAGEGAPAGRGAGASGGQGLPNLEPPGLPPAPPPPAAPPQGAAPAAGSSAGEIPAGSKAAPAQPTGASLGGASLSGAGLGAPVPAGAGGTPTGRHLGCWVARRSCRRLPHRPARPAGW